MRNTHLGGRRSVDLNLALLRKVAARLGTLRERVMFLGGAILPLLIPEPVADGIRVAKDVDIMVHADSKADLWAFEDQLWDAGLKKRTTGATCHWCLDDIPIDVLTTEPDTVDFINNWGFEAVQQQQQRDLGGGLVVNVIRSTHYIAVKIDAYHRRGFGGHQRSVDIYDILLLLRGCPDIESDFHHRTSAPLQSHLAAELSALLQAGVQWQKGPKPQTEAKTFDAFTTQWKPEAVERMHRLVGNGHDRRIRVQA